MVGIWKQITKITDFEAKWVKTGQPKNLWHPQEQTFLNLVLLDEGSHLLVMMSKKLNSFCSASSEIIEVKVCQTQTDRQTKSQVLCHQIVGKWIFSSS